mmetsp:Transcript_14525/g.46362  ORF Transcript_14525/g.46362 Transcript_14525/m.46362 type:complete len:436 (-) Transcript_14525:234-1541(-)
MADGRARLGPAYEREVDARVQRQGQGSAGVVLCEEGGSLGGVHLIAAQNAVLQIVQGEDESADEVASLSEERGKRSAWRAMHHCAVDGERVVHVEAKRLEFRWLKPLQVERRQQRGLAHVGCELGVLLHGLVVHVPAVAAEEAGVQRQHAPLQRRCQGGGREGGRIRAEEGGHIDRESTWSHRHVQRARLCRLPKHRHRQRQPAHASCCASASIRAASPLQLLSSPIARVCLLHGHAGRRRRRRCRNWCHPCVLPDPLLHRLRLAARPHSYRLPSAPQMHARQRCDSLCQRQVLQLRRVHLEEASVGQLCRKPRDGPGQTLAVATPRSLVLDHDRNVWRCVAHAELEVAFCADRDHAALLHRAAALDGRPLARCCCCGAACCGRGGAVLRRLLLAHHVADDLLHLAWFGSHEGVEEATAANEGQRWKRLDAELQR